MEVRNGGFAMAAFAIGALARAISRVSGVDVDTESLKVVVTFSSLGLLLSFLFIIFGFELL
jgi:hypothetical protein